MVASGVFPFSPELIASTVQSEITNLQMVAGNLASEAAENWIYIQGQYIENDKVLDMTKKLIESYQ